MKILKEGLAVCIYEPRGEKGLEGYSLERGYHYQIIESNKDNYYKIFPDKNDMIYGETCSKNFFKKCFNTVVEIDYKPMEVI
mgnify:CR=1 FL=1